jgi:hypothetical protein
MIVDSLTTILHNARCERGGTKEYIVEKESYQGKAHLKA